MKNWIALTNFSVSLRYHILRNFSALAPETIERQTQIHFRRNLTSLFRRRQVLESDFGTDTR